MKLSMSLKLILALGIICQIELAEGKRNNYIHGTESRVIGPENTQIDNSCIIYADDISRKFFANIILYKRYNLMHFRLNFSGFDIGETKYVIGKEHWVWTYKGHEGGHTYLYLPNDYSYLSFGILQTRSLLEEYFLTFKHSGNCTGLKVGTNETDYLIGQAFGNLTSPIADLDDRYNSSYWCYTRRLWLESDILYWACKNSICTFQTFEYRCCRYYIHFLTRKRVVICNDNHYLFGQIWWMLPIIVGETCFAFYPLLLMKIGSAMNSLSRSIRKKKRFLNYNIDNKRDDSLSLSDEQNTRPRPNGHYIRLKYGSPISFVSTICTPFLNCNMSGPISKRILRSAIIFLPMVLSATRVGLDYRFAPHLIAEAVSKGALVGFSSLLAGYENAKREFLHVFGGPYVAISIYIIFGCFALSIPNNLEKSLLRGLFLPQGRSRCLLSIPIKKREQFSRIYFQNEHGYKKIYLYLKAKFCMLLNIKFWKFVMTLFYTRWRCGLYQCLLRCLRVRLLAWLIMLISLPVYFVTCITELIISVIYFAFPVINTFFLVYKAFSVNYFNDFSHTNKLCALLKVVLFLPLSVCFFVTWYMYCIIFFDGFWFLSKIAMFTYSGIIAYPKLSYGYLILSFMAVYYLVESVSKFNESYRNLLKLTIDACQRIQHKNHGEDHVQILHKKGVPIEMFSAIVERHMPIRNQLFTTLFRFVSIVTILCVSIDLLKKFDKIEDISLVSHVFTVIFICALPKIIRVMFLDKREYTYRKQLMIKIEKSLEFMIQNYSSTDSDEYESWPEESGGYRRLNPP